MRFRKLAVTAAVLIASCGGGAATTTTDTPATTSAAVTTAIASTTVPATTTEPTTAAPSAFPVTIEADNGSVTVDAEPHSIVSLSPTATEMLFAIGAGDQVIAVDEFSNHPAEAPVTDLSGFTPNIEAIASYQPDLVVVSYDPGDLVASLDALGVPVVVQGGAVSIEDSYRQLEQLGSVTGHADAASLVVEEMKKGLAAVVAGLPPEATGLTYYYELGPELYTATSDTFIGQLFAMLGIENVADPADADGSAFGYPQLSAEYLIEADPDLVFLADTLCCSQNTETVASRPGWGAMSAVENGAIVELDDDVASRWGPRVVELLEAIAAGVENAAGGG